MARLGSLIYSTINELRAGTDVASTREGGACLSPTPSATFLPIVVPGCLLSNVIAVDELVCDMPGENIA
jgi:hypothetical protein